MSSPSNLTILFENSLIKNLRIIYWIWTRLQTKERLWIKFVHLVYMAERNKGTNNLSITVFVCSGGQQFVFKHFTIHIFSSFEKEDHIVELNYSYSNLL